MAPNVGDVVSGVGDVAGDIAGGIKDFVTTLFSEQQLTPEQEELFGTQADYADLMENIARNRSDLVGPTRQPDGRQTGPMVDALNTIMGNVANVQGRGRGRIQARPFNPFGPPRDVQTFGANYNQPAQNPYDYGAPPPPGTEPPPGVTVTPTPSVLPTVDPGGWNRDLGGAWRTLGDPVSTEVTSIPDMPDDLGGAWRDLDFPGAPKFGWDPIDVSKYMKLPDLPDMPDWRDFGVTPPGWPDMPSLPGGMGWPSRPDIPGMGWPEMPDMPSLPGGMGWPEMPSLPGGMGWPDMPGKPDLGGAWRDLTGIIPSLPGMGWPSMPDRPKLPGWGTLTDWMPKGLPDIDEMFEMTPAQEEAYRDYIMGLMPGKSTTLGGPLEMGDPGFGDRPLIPEDGIDLTGPIRNPLNIKTREQTGLLASGVNVINDIIHGRFLNPTKGRKASPAEHVQDILAHPDTKTFSVLTSYMTDEERGWLTQRDPLTKEQTLRLNEVLGQGYTDIEQYLQWQHDNFGPTSYPASEIYDFDAMADAYLTGGIQGLDRWREQVDKDRWADTPDNVLAEYGMERTEDGDVRRIVTEPGSMVESGAPISSIITDQTEARDLRRQAAADAIADAKTPEERELARRTFAELARRNFADV